MADLDVLRSIGAVAKFPKSQAVFMQNDIGSNVGIFGVYINPFNDFPIRVAGSSMI